jgi:uncharacterized SAM-binding protein YcdF (DUF218 family)
MSVPKNSIIRFFLAAIASICSLYIVVAIYVGMHVYDDTAKRSDVIIVLGAKSYKNRTREYNPCLVERVNHGVELYKKGLAGTLLFTGGDDTEDGSNEAETMKEIAVKQGIPESSVALENHSTSTYENFMLSKKIMDTHGWKSAVVVTEPFHSPRASLVAMHEGIDASVSPATESQCWNRWTFLSRYFLKEPIAIFVYKLTGKL